jgi:hypothetical protein
MVISAVMKERFQSHTARTVRRWKSRIANWRLYQRTATERAMGATGRRALRQAEWVPLWLELQRVILGRVASRVALYQYRALLAIAVADGVSHARPLAAIPNPTVAT